MAVALGIWIAAMSGLVISQVCQFGSFWVTANRCQACGSDADSFSEHRCQLG